ncbi:hypothetical protein STANM309S_05030 [Streptomyces tanashiensis]
MGVGVGFGVGLGGGALVGAALAVAPVEEGPDGPDGDPFEGTRWRARFFVELVDEGAHADGVARLCSTDQVRFERRANTAARGASTGAWEAAALADVPALVFRRRCGTSTCSWGWRRSGPTRTGGTAAEDRAYDGYWESWSFGELTEPALIRRETLARLLPRTRIADRVELTDRFLRVRGELRAYRIHLGLGERADGAGRLLSVRGGGPRAGPGEGVPAVRGGRRAASR